MPVIAFASFIVVPKNALTLDHIRKPILEGMFGWRDGFWNTPDGNFSKCVGSQNDTTANQRDGLHVGDDANTPSCCQSLQHLVQFAAQLEHTAETAQRVGEMKPRPPASPPRLIDRAGDPDLQLAIAVDICPP
jgi:hypothetical protein